MKESYREDIAMHIKLKKLKDESHSFDEVLSAHRMLIFGKGSSPRTHKGKLIDHDTAIKVLEKNKDNCLGRFYWRLATRARS